LRILICVVLDILRPNCKSYFKKGELTMPLEKNFLHAADSDAETRLENDKNKDLKLIGEHDAKQSRAEAQSPSSDLDQ
jgi:hypothetical protein